MKFVAGGLALLVGAACAVAEVWGVWEYMLREQGQYNYLWAMGVLGAVAFALLPMWAAFAWREAPSLSLPLYACWIVAGVVVIGAALTRTGSAVDMAQLDRVAADRAHAIAEQSVKDGERQLVSDERTYNAECATGNGLKCQDARRARDATRDRLDAARSKLESAKGSAGDTLARRAAATGYVTEDQFRNVWPLLPPLLCSVLSAFLISLGVALLSAGVIPGAEKNPIQPEPQLLEKIERLPTPSATVSHLAEVKAVTEGEVTKFMIARMPAADGEHVEIADAYVAYLAYCKDIGAKPIEAKRFARTFSEICKRASIKTQRRDGKVYCIGRKIVA